MDTDPYIEFRERADYKVCYITATLRFNNIGTADQLDEYLANKLTGVFLPDIVRREILAERDPAARARDEQRGITIMTSKEREEYGKRLEAQNTTLRDPVRIQVDNLRREVSDALQDYIEKIRSSIETSGTSLKAEAIASTFDSIDDMENFFRRKTRLARLARFLGIARRQKPRPEPFIEVTFRTSLHGAETAIRRAGEDLKTALSGVGHLDRFDANIQESPFRIRPDAEPYVSYENQVKHRLPLPERGQEIFDELDIIGTALKSADSDRAFGAAEQFAKLLCRDHDAALLLVENPVFPHNRHPRFPGGSPRAMAKALRRHVAQLHRLQDAVGLCDLFFESRPPGVVDTLLETIQKVAEGHKPGNFYDKAARTVFGDPLNAALHFSAFKRDGKAPIPKRLQEINEQCQDDINTLEEAVMEHIKAEFAKEHMDHDDDTGPTISP